MFRKFNVEISFRDMLLGGRPRTRDLIEKWLEEREIKINSGVDLRCVTRGGLKAIKSSQIKTSSWNTFEVDEEGLFIEERNLKGMLREAGMVSQVGRRAGFGDMIRNGVFAKPERIHLQRDGCVIKKPDGYFDHVALLKGRCRSRSALKRFDYVKQPKLDFELWVAAIGLSDEDVQDLFCLGQEVGLGACRTQGFGKFDANLRPTQKQEAEQQPKN